MSVFAPQLTGHGKILSSHHLRFHHRLVNACDKSELRIRALCNDGHLHLAVDALSGIASPPSDTTYIALLRACLNNRHFHHIKRVHDHIARHRSRLIGLLGDYLVVSLARCGFLEDAHRVAVSLSSRTVYSWSALISAYADAERGEEALNMLELMQKEGILPNNYTYVSLFKACSTVPDVGHGRELHADACKKGFTSDHLVGNTLVSMYGKCGAITEAEHVFATMKQHDAVSWNIMLAVYVEQGDIVKAFCLYTTHCLHLQITMQGMYPDQWTFAIMLHACATFAEEKVAMESVRSIALAIGEALHADARKKGCMSDILIGNTLVHLYGKCGTSLQAETMFVTLSERDVVTWNAMLSAYIDQNDGVKALQLYSKMQAEGEIPDQLTFLLIFQACGMLAETKEANILEEHPMKETSLKIGLALHVDACKKGFASDIVICNALVTMYGKCGAVIEMEDMFSLLPNRDVVTWNALFSAYAEQGLGERTLLLYDKMQAECKTIDDVTFMCLLQACSETGDLELCKQLHFYTVSVNHDQKPSVAATIVHTYGSCACVADARGTFNGLRVPDTVAWNACIASHAGGDSCDASLELFEELKQGGSMPSAESFISILTYCCRAGLVLVGLECFHSMIIHHGMLPNIKHYGIMVDLLGRAGDFKLIDKLMATMPIQADLTLWLSLLGACRTHANFDLARDAFRNALRQHSNHPTAYVLMSNIYEDAEIQEYVLEI